MREFAFVMYSDVDDNWCRLNESSFLTSTVTLLIVGVDGMRVHANEVRGVLNDLWCIWMV